MIIGDPIFDLSKLQPDDQPQDVVRDRIERDGDHASEQRRFERLMQLGFDRFKNTLGLGFRIRIGAKLHNSVGADVRSQKDDRVLEVDLAAFAVFQHALIKYLEEKLHHVRMRLFDLVKQHYRIRFAPDRLGQHAAFAVADISRRRTLETRNGVCLLVFAHIYRDQVAFAAI